MIRFSCFFIFIAIQQVFAQQAFTENLFGEVRMNDFPVEGVFVINKNTEEGVETDQDGFFSIKVKLGDVLVFSSIQTKVKELVIEEEHILNPLNKIQLHASVNLLREVVIRNYKGINSRALGIIPQETKSYTAAERKLKTATDLKGQGGVSLDPLLNVISGRTAMLKKELAVEQKEVFLRLLEEMFDRNHFVNNLSIPSDYVKGFEYYAVDNIYFTRILKSKNKTTTEFLLGELALKYKDIIACENE